MSATRPVTALPWLLYLLTVIFVLDVGLLIWHWRPGRRNEQRVEDMDQDELAAADLEAMWDAPAAARTNPTPPLVDRMG